MPVPYVLEDIVHERLGLVVISLSAYSNVQGTVVVYIERKTSRNIRRNVRSWKSIECNGRFPRYSKMRANDVGKNRYRFKKKWVRRSCTHRKSCTFLFSQNRRNHEKVTSIVQSILWTTAVEKKNFNLKKGVYAIMHYKPPRMYKSIYLKKNLTIDKFCESKYILIRNVIFTF